MQLYSSNLGNDRLMWNNGFKYINSLKVILSAEYNINSYL